MRIAAGFNKPQSFVAERWEGSCGEGI